MGSQKREKRSRCRKRSRRSRTRKRYLAIAKRKTYGGKKFLFKRTCKYDSFEWNLCNSDFGCENEQDVREYCQRHTCRNPGCIDKVHREGWILCTQHAEMNYYVGENPDPADVHERKYPLLYNKEKYESLEATPNRVLFEPAPKPIRLNLPPEPQPPTLLSYFSY